MSTDRIENVVVIGSGPAGYTAAIYAGRANLKPLVFEGFQAGGIPGGQLMTTTEVENFPGFPLGITGPALMRDMKAQAQRWGAELYVEDVVYVDLSQRPFVVRSEDREVRTHSLIIATGATAKRLHLPSEGIYWNQGISACAICDGAIPIFKDVELAVVGGGDTAAEEATFLTKYGSHVHMLVRRDVMRASKAMQDRVLRHPKITVHWNTEPVDVLGNGVRMTGLRLRDTRTGDERDIPMGGLFYAIGHTPNTGLFRGQLELDDVGYVVTKPSSVATSVEGVFAAGDVQDHEFRQAITAAGTGCMAAMLAERWLSANGLDQEFHHQAEEPDRLYAATIPFESLVTDVEFGDSESTPADPPSAAVDAGTGAEPAASAPTQTTADDLDLSKTHHEGGYALRRLYHETDKLILVKYTSPTCGPCHTLKPILNKVVDEFTGQIYTVEIDISLEPEIAEAGGVTGTPTVQLFKQKDKVGQVMGVKPKSQYRELIEKYL